MDHIIHNIKTFRCLVFAIKRHTKHKTMRAPRVKRGQALYRTGKSPPARFLALCGLLNENLMAVDFTKCRKSDRLFSFPRGSPDYSLIWLSAWQCYIAKYP